ncbi:hypothetical protein C8R42DRAFT_666831 [Lentinula raphanica]|nr:hypothetical protein C8R42DRAFT_666831 [Lentinula raphanica]
MKIEWASDFHRDGSRRRHPIPSTMHGWLAKMRGTLIGNETLRSQGIQEMKAAKRRKQAAKARAQSSKGRFSFFARKPAPQRTNFGNSRRGNYRGRGHRGDGYRSGAVGNRPALRQHQSGSHHRPVGQTSRRSSGTQPQGPNTRPGPSRRTTATSQRRGTTQRRPSGR